MAQPQLTDPKPLEWTGNPNAPADERLRAALLDAWAKLKGVAVDPGTDAAAFERCRLRLECAESEAKRGAHYAAWDCVAQFDLEFLALMPKSELAARFVTFRARARANLTGSRATAAEDLIKQVCSGEKQRACVERAESDIEKYPTLLEKARELREHLIADGQNKYLKIALLQESLRALRLVLVPAVLLALGLGLTELWLDLGWLRDDAAEALVIGIGAGALGGLISMAFALGRSDLKAKIPEVQFSGVVVWTRPMLGAAAAIPVALLTVCEFVTVKGLEYPWSVFAFCFLAGFSERWFLGFVERLEGAKK